MIRAGYDPAGAVTPVQQPSPWWVDFDRRMTGLAGRRPQPLDLGSLPSMKKLDELASYTRWASQ